MRCLEIEIPAGGADRFGSRDGASEAGIALSPLGIVVSEHADKIGFFEPAVEILDKEVLPDRIRIVVRVADGPTKPLEEIVRGYRIGCFKIAREYGLVTPTDSSPIFGEGFACREIAWDG